MYKIVKCDVPIIFIDTFALIEFQKAKDSRYLDLFTILATLVNQKKIICPLADQEDEIFKSRLCTLSNFSKLSLGIRFEDEHTIFLKQYYRMLKHSLSSGQRYPVYYLDGFKKNPVDEINKKQNSIIITVASEPNEKQINSVKERVRKNTEELNLFKSSSFNLGHFQLQLEKEKFGFYQAAKKSKEDYINQINNGLQLSEELNSQFMDLYYKPFTLFTEVFGNNQNDEDFFNFLQSDLFARIPYQDVYNMLISDIVVSNKIFESGDIQDIINLSSLLPYCDIVLTDRAQRNRIRRLGLDAKYHTEVFCMNDFENLKDRLIRIMSNC